MRQPLISIVIPLYNRKDLIRETLTSVQAQTYPHWEAIIVDDGSTDGSFELVRQIAEKDSQIKLLKRTRLPKGAPTCRNIGAEKAAGKYLIFLDSDDILANYCLEQRVKYVQKYPDLDFLVFPIMLFHREKDDMNILWNIDTGEDDLIRFLRLDAVWQTSSPIFKKSYILNTEGFSEGLPFWQDYELHVRLLIHKPSYLKFLSEKPDVYCRRHAGHSISQIPLFSEKQLEKKLQISNSILNRLIENQWGAPYKCTFKITIFTILENLISKYPNNPYDYLKCWGKLHLLGLSSGVEGVFIKNYFLVLKYSRKFTWLYPIKVVYRKLIPRKFKQRKTTLCRVHLDHEK